jgi:hypothetical protein
MPAQRLNGGPVSVRRYDVAGVDADPASTPNFIGHVGLFAGDRDELRCNDRAFLVHMKPPLELGEGEESVHAIGILAWYDFPISTGPLEGTNNKIKTMKRQAYGFRDIEFFKLKILGIHETRYALVG